MGAVQYFLLPLLICSAAGSWADRPPDILLEEVLSIGNLENAVLFQWVGVAVDSECNIYVTDAMDYSIKKFSAAGDLIKKTGRKGEGPGEFTALRLLDCMDEAVFVTEQYAPVIKVFDSDLRFKYTIRIAGPVGDLKVLSDSRLAVVAMTAQKKSVILFLDQRGQTVNKLVYAEESSSFLTDMVSFDVDSQGNIYLAYNFLDRIEKFSKTGAKVWSKKLLDIKRVESKKVGSFVVPAEIVFKDIALDTSGRLYVLGGHYSGNKSRDVYVISPQGKHLATFTLPEASHCIYIDKKNYLYTRANEGITLKKYRVTIDIK
jgi:hypothetical protein